METVELSNLEKQEEQLEIRKKDIKEPALGRYFEHHNAFRRINECIYCKTSRRSMVSI